MEESCVFCKIVNGEIPSTRVWNNEEFLAIADANPIDEGHTLVIPKKHFESLLDLDGSVSSNYIDALKKVGKILMKKYEAEGFNVVLNNGEAAGQVVGHVHFHLLPRNKGDKKRGLFIG